MVIEKMQVIGYGDMRRYKPSPLNTILKRRKEDFFVLWEDGKVQGLHMTHSGEENREGFIKETTEKYINIQIDTKNELYSYISLDGNIYTQHPKSMLEVMLLDIDRLKKSGEDLKLINAVIEMYNTDAKIYNIDLLPYI